MQWVMQGNCALGGTIRHDRSDILYTSLAQDPRFESVGKITGNELGGGFLASGTLVADHWVLTAAHIVEGTDGFGAGVSNLQFEVGNSNYMAEQLFVHPNWSASGGTSNLFAGWDLALVRLEQTVSGVAPVELFSNSNELGQTATIVGFGATGTGLSGAQPNTAGTKRAGNNIVDIAGTQSTPGSILSIGNDRMLAIDFDQPGNPSASTLGDSTPLDLEYLPAPGDSGGGLFLEQDGEMLLAGVTSLTSTLDGSVNSSYGDRAAFTRVSPFLTWIEETIAANSLTSPLPLPGDFDGDGSVDGADFLAWQRGFGAAFGLEDLTDWETNFGASSGFGDAAAQFPQSQTIPEPSSYALLLLGFAGVLFTRNSWTCRNISCEQTADELDIQIIGDAEFYLLVGKYVLTKVPCRVERQHLCLIYNLNDQHLTTAEEFANSDSGLHLRALLEDWSLDEIESALQSS